MLGRSVNAGYRGDLNLLSQRDYTLSRRRYIAMHIARWQAASTDRRSDERLPTS
jgi:hypothetical protein